MKRKPYAIDDRQTPETPSRNPWKWIPTLYFAEALPYVTVMSISTVMYEMGGGKREGHSGYGGGDEELHGQYPPSFAFGKVDERAP